MAELDTFCSRKGESQPATVLLLFPFLRFLPICILHQCWWLADILHSAHLTEWTIIFFPLYLARLVFCQFGKLNQLLERSDKLRLQEKKEQEWPFGQQ